MDARSEEEPVLICDLQREVLMAMLRPDAEPSAPGTLVRLADEAGERWWSALDEPGPDDHRIAHLEREVGALIVEHAPVAVAVGTVIRGVPDPRETWAIWAVERGGETLAIRMHTIVTADGQIVAGPVGKLDDLEAGLAPIWVKALRAAAG